MRSIRSFLLASIALLLLLPSLLWFVPHRLKADREKAPNCAPRTLKGADYESPIVPSADSLQRDKDAWRKALTQSRSGAEEADAIRQLAHLLAGNPAPVEVRLKAIATLEVAGQESREATQAIAKALKDDADNNVRLRAAEALWSRTSDPSPILPVLRAILNERHVPSGQATKSGGSARDKVALQCRALELLWGIGPPAEELVSDILRFMAHHRDDWGARGYGARALGRIGGKGAAVVSVLEQYLSDDDGLVRAAAAEALWRVDKSRKDMLIAVISSTVSLISAD